MSGAPTVEALVRRLIDTPAAFLADPVVPALVGDLAVAMGAIVTGPDVAAFGPHPPGAPLDNGHRCTAVAVWLLHDPAFLDDPDPDGMWRLLRQDVPMLATVVPADRLVTDPERREELVRLALRAMGRTPAGETEAQAADRLATLDSAERARVLAATRAAEERAAAVRKAMHEKAAAEAAAKASRE